MLSLHGAGAETLGELVQSGVGSPADRACVPNEDVLVALCRENNEQLFTELRSDEHAEELLRATYADEALGRLFSTKVVSAKDSTLDRVLLHPRFGVAQAREDGSVKVRPVDNMSWGPADRAAVGAQRPSKKARKVQSVNGFVAPGEKMHHDTVDTLAAMLRQFVLIVGCIPGLFKVPPLCKCMKLCR